MSVFRQFSSTASTGLRSVARRFSTIAMDRRIFKPNLSEFYDSSPQDFMTRLSSSNNVVTLGTGEKLREVHIEAITKNLYVQGIT